MRILVLQFAADVRGRPVPRFDPQLGTLLRLLTDRGHPIDLCGVARFSLDAIKAALARALPQLIYADISAICVDAARRTFEYIVRHEFLPIVAGGEYPTVAPAAALSLPGVHAVALGEPDATLVTYLERIKDPAVSQVVSGVWLRDEQGLRQPELPPLVEDLDSLPPPRRDLFHEADIVRMTGQVELAIGRGCEQRCAYWTDPAIARLYAGRGTWVRRRSPEHVVREVVELRERYPEVSLVRFLDRGFALDTHWLAEFLELYALRCPLPFRCHLRANALDANTAERLARAGCALADIDVISASDFIRNDVFNMALSEPQIREAFAALSTAGIARRATFLLGAPYESEASLDAVRALLADLQPEVVDLRPYYPWPGTAACALAQEQGWLHARGEEQYHLDRCGIDMPACRPDVVHAALRRLRAEFPGVTNDSWWRRWRGGARPAWERVFRRR